MSIMANPEVTRMSEGAAIAFAEWVWGIIIHKSIKGEGYYIVREEDGTTNVRSMNELYNRWLGGGYNHKATRCPACGNDDMFSFELIHYKCRACGEQFTN